MVSDSQNRVEPLTHQLGTERNVNSMQQIRAKTMGRTPEKTKDEEACNRYAEGLLGVHRVHK